jgi:3',5'-cyclic AMP phosphodiesterase CpdA
MMRVVVTSDTHYQPYWAGRLLTFIQEIRALYPDVIVLGGDVGEGVSGYEGMLALLEKLACPHLILTGNHDLWKWNGHSSRELWETVLPALTRQHNAIWLEGENWIKDGLAICGTNGWYDYSAADPTLPFLKEQYAEMKKNIMVDGRAIDWGWTDLEFADRVGDAFEKRLATLQADPTVREILIVTHVPAFEEGVARKPNNLSWNMGNAYFGNLTLGKRIVKYDKVKRVVSGHTHVGKHAQIGAIDMHVTSADYGNPVYLVFDYA